MDRLRVWRYGLGLKDTPAPMKPTPLAPDRWMVGIALSYLCCVVASRLLFAHPFSNDDILHWAIAQDSWLDPKLLLNVWGRPGFTALFSGPAQLGFDATRLASVLLTLGTGLLTASALRSEGRLAMRLGLAFLLFQTALFKISNGALTEPVYAFFLAAGLAAYRQQHRDLAALLWGYTAICRLEGMPMLLVFALVFLRDALAQRRQGGSFGWGPLIRRVFLLGAWLLVWDVALAATMNFETWLPILTRNGFLAAEEPAYGSGPWYDYLRRAPNIHGITVALLLPVGIGVLLSRKRWFLPTFVLVFYAMQSALWATGSFATAGYDRFLASIAPFCAICGVHGALGLRTRPWARNGATGGVRFFLWPGFLVGALVLHTIAFSFGQRAICDSWYRQHVRAFEDLRSEGGVHPDAPLLTSCWHAHLLLPRDTRRDEEQLKMLLTRETLAEAEPGTWVLFVSHGPVSEEGVALASFYRESALEQLRPRREAGLNFAHLLGGSDCRPRYRQVADHSLLTLFPSNALTRGLSPLLAPYDDVDRNPRPYYVRLFRVVHEP